MIEYRKISATIEILRHPDSKLFKLGVIQPKYSLLNNLSQCFWRILMRLDTQKSFAKNLLSIQRWNMLKAKVTVLTIWCHYKCCFSETWPFLHLAQSDYMFHRSAFRASALHSSVRNIKPLGPGPLQHYLHLSL